MPTRAGWPVAVLAALIPTGCTPLYTWDSHTASTARAASLDAADLARQPVATVALVAPSALQGFGPALSLALIAALAEASPPIRGIPAYETLNALNDRDLAVEYGDLLAGFARSGILDRERLQRLASSLGFRYLLVPGLTELNQLILDKFELAGFKLVRTRVTVLRLWLQLWDARTGHVLWESTGSIGTASDVFRQERMVPIDAIAQRLWSRMIQRDLLDGTTGPHASLRPQ